MSKKKQERKGGFIADVLFVGKRIYEGKEFYDYKIQLAGDEDNRYDLSKCMDNLDPNIRITPNVGDMITYVLEGNRMKKVKIIENVFPLMGPRETRNDEYNLRMVRGNINL